MRGVVNMSTGRAANGGEIIAGIQNDSLQWRNRIPAVQCFRSLTYTRNTVRTSWHDGSVATKPKQANNDDGDPLEQA